MGNAQPYGTARTHCIFKHPKSMPFRQTDAETKHGRVNRRALLPQILVSLRQSIRRVDPDAITIESCTTNIHQRHFFYCYERLKQRIRLCSVLSCHTSLEHRMLTTLDSSGHSGRFGHEFLGTKTTTLQKAHTQTLTLTAEFDFRVVGDGRQAQARYANNSNYRNDSLIRKESALAPGPPLRRRGLAPSLT